MRLRAFRSSLKAPLESAAKSWFPTLSDVIINDLTHLETAFKERFASGPHADWILLQQLSARKQRSKDHLVVMLQVYWISLSLLRCRAIRPRVTSICYYNPQIVDLTRAVQFLY